MNTQYEKMVDEIAKTMKLTKQEKEKLLKNKAAKLVALVPYLSKANDAQRKSINRLLLFAGGSIPGRKSETFNCSPTDTLNNLWGRIDIICPNDSTASDCHIVTAARYRLMYLQLADMKRDVEEDKEQLKYNPFSDGASVCDMDRLYNEIVTNQIIEDQVDAILPIEDAKAGWWW